MKRGQEQSDKLKVLLFKRYAICKRIFSRRKVVWRGAERRVEGIQYAMRSLIGNMLSLHSSPYLVGTLGARMLGDALLLVIARLDVGRRDVVAVGLSRGGGGHGWGRGQG